MLLNRSVKVSSGSPWRADRAQSGCGGWGGARRGKSVDAESIPACGVNLVKVPLAEEAGPWKVEQSSSPKSLFFFFFYQRWQLSRFPPKEAAHYFWTQKQQRRSSEVPLASSLQLYKIIFHFCADPKARDEFRFLPEVSVSAEKWGLNSQPVSTQWPVSTKGFNSRLKLVKSCGKRSITHNWLNIDIH